MENSSTIAQKSEKALKKILKFKLIIVPKMYCNSVEKSTVKKTECSQQQKCTFVSQSILFYLAFKDKLNYLFELQNVFI